LVSSEFLRTYLIECGLGRFFLDDTKQDARFNRYFLPMPFPRSGLRKRTHLCQRTARRVMLDAAIERGWPAALMEKAGNRAEPAR
jgi:hypothetical protein